VSRGTLIDLLYLFSRRRSSSRSRDSEPKHARGNMVAAFGMLVAIVRPSSTDVDGHALRHVWLILLAWPLASSSRCRRRAS